MLPEKAHERWRSRKMQPFGDLEDRHIRGFEAAFRLDYDHLVDPLLHGMSGHSLYDLGQVLRSHAQFVGVKRDTTLRFVILQHQVEKVMGQPLAARHDKGLFFGTPAVDGGDDNDDQRHDQRITYLRRIFFIGGISLLYRIYAGKIVHSSVVKAEARAGFDHLKPVEVERYGQRVEEVPRDEQQPHLEIGGRFQRSEYVAGQQDEQLACGYARNLVVQTEIRMAACTEPENHPVKRQRLSAPLAFRGFRHLHKDKISDLQVFSTYSTYIHKKARQLFIRNIRNNAYFSA